MVLIFLKNIVGVDFGVVSLVVVFFGELVV